MIAVRLWYVALILAGTAAAVLGYLVADAGRPAATVLCLLAASACWAGCSRVRQTAYRLQDREHAARPGALADPCCELAFLTRGRDHYACCGRTR
ncbi:hypothetical protein [Streptomyces nitrosporeus]|uniref:hypothetical protein n=1 Tax=Streptomyces nitrosporeus TaxID=28894 RepID=UPI00399F999B